MSSQVEYYFSNENLPTDKYMLGLIKKNKEGFGMLLWALFCFIEILLTLDGNENSQ